MADFPSMPLWTDAYIGDTMHLSLEEHGAYLKLLMIAWRTPDCSLPNDDKRLATMLGITPKKWASIKPTVMAFWTTDGTTWRQKKLTEVRRAVTESKDKLSSAGKAGAEAKWLKEKKRGDGDANGDAISDANGDAYANQNQNHKKDSSLRSESKNARASRISENWEPSLEDASWAKAEYGASDAELRKLTEEFRDYWLAESGQRARKVDWSRTWRNRCRQVWEGRRKAAPKSSAVDWRQAAQSFARFGSWPAWAPGPAPDQPGCKCPDEILREFGLRRAA